MVVLASIAILLVVWPWIVRLGGPGLVLIGFADNSLLLPGSMDVLTIWLAASHREFWPYYAFMATAGAVLGGYVTYSLGRKGGKQAIELKLRRDKARKLFSRFARLGFRTVVFSAILPPPFPLVPVLLAAGALQYPRKKFLAALALGRGVRYFLIAGLGSLYGHAIVGFLRQYYLPALLILVGLAAVGALLTLVEYFRVREKRRHQEPVGRAA